ncbi:MAG: uroporphyrinogen-III C-methyltransferase [Rubrivivax sp.]
MRLPWAGWLTLILLLASSVTASWLAFSAQTRVRTLESELVKRLQLSADQAIEARLAARQAQEVSRDAAAKLALLEARVAESTVQRSQIEDLMQSVARSRDENVVADVEAALRVAMQQSAITGSADPVLTALRQSEERLARYSEPQLERVRRALASDAERVKAVSITDVSALAARLDDVIRQVDDLPMLVRPEPRTARSVRPARGAAASAVGAAAAARPPAVASTAAASAVDGGAADAGWSQRWSDWGAVVWAEVRALVRVTPIDQPEAMLVAPEQAYFLRENLKLRLLNARLALLSRQYDTAQADLRDVRVALERYFDRGARSVQVATETVRQISGQAHLVIVPRPDATLAALAAAGAGR